jgi:hypothetical protein
MVCQGIVERINFTEGIYENRYCDLSPSVGVREIELSALNKSTAMCEIQVYVTVNAYVPHHLKYIFERLNILLGLLMLPASLAGSE